MIPAFVWPLLVIGGLCLWATLSARSITRRANKNWAAVEAERKAREAQA